ncbi:MAG: hypothetical protein IAE81_07370 [Caldilineaceae bacterium]|jgi:hypothetical protein|nr:hypothetical protein [Caldilineaceae bacterium]
MNEEQRSIKPDQPAVYRIEVQGALDLSWDETFGKLHIEHRLDAHGAVVTILTGEVPDQAALAGVLSLTYSLGMPLLSVKYLR